MGRVINPESSSKERTQLTRGIVLALRELMRQSEPNADTRDLAAFIAMALESIHGSIETSVEAWEKRGYWLKADRYRMEWAWTGKTGQAIRSALLAEDWPTIAINAAQVAQKLQSVELPKRNTLGAPWVGAYKRLAQK
ncbi:MAG: hypothetical protein ACKOC5_04455 [Chloroflexota bacterium]